MSNNTVYAIQSPLSHIKFEFKKITNTHTLTMKIRIILTLLALPIAGHTETHISYGLHHGAGYFEHDSDSNVSAATVSISHKVNAKHQLKLSSGYNKINHKENKQEDEGIADTSLSHRYRQLLGKNHLIDIKSKIKFPTANEDKNLGTGKHDFTLGISQYNRISDFWILSEISHKWRGDNDNRKMENGYSAKLGISSITKAKTSGGGFLSYHEASSNRTTERKEITGYLSYRKSKQLKSTLYVIHGLSEASPQWAGGIQIKQSFDF